MISILMPTRGRPDNMETVVMSAYQTADQPDKVEFSVYIDDDDYESQNQAVNLGIDLVTLGPRIVLSEMWNCCYDNSHGDIFMHCGDDIIFRTDGWDTLVEDAFKVTSDKILFVHGRDGYHDMNFGTHGFIHKKWVETVGYFVPPYFSSDYNDAWLNDVANALGRRSYIPEIYTEHMHPNFGKAELDITHQERLIRHKQDNVDQLYVDLLPKRLEDIEKLRAVIQ